MSHEERRARRELVQPKRKVKPVKQLTTNQQRERAWRKRSRRD